MSGFMISNKGMLQAIRQVFPYEPVQVYHTEDMKVYRFDYNYSICDELINKEQEIKVAIKKLTGLKRLGTQVGLDINSGVCSIFVSKC